MYLNYMFSQSHGQGSPSWCQAPYQCQPNTVLIQGWIGIPVLVHPHTVQWYRTGMVQYAPYHPVWYSIANLGHGCMVLQTIEYGCMVITTMTQAFVYILQQTLASIFPSQIHPETMRENSTIRFHVHSLLSKVQ